MSGMSRKSGYDFCDENMPDVLSRHEFLLLGRDRPNGNHAVAVMLQRKPFQFVQF
ncbi:MULTISPECIES: hypothetical protein [unclassified Bosea (in: a-proteobacteria)]|uniref:hypothetical protein n=1 Tax=unclassified Bosea (in: a-proteobacteria) TaxID=2653178 RepID=UPI00135B4D4E|nr:MULTISPECIES: hypothetical protein [unclassified Bosea (in: a-proteobacteria)]